MVMVSDGWQRRLVVTVVVTVMVLLVGNGGVSYSRNIENV
jgi:hypothetical protein